MWHRRDGDWRAVDGISGTSAVALAAKTNIMIGYDHDIGDGTQYSSRQSARLVINVQSCGDWSWVESFTGRQVHGVLV